MTGSSYGIEGSVAPDWDVTQWINLPTGKTKFERTDFLGKVLYLYCFQSWCPGCHSHGFPALQELGDYYQTNNDVAFVAVQTVFEGFHVNTIGQAGETARQYSLQIPIGHDPGTDGQRSLIMQRYRTGGTPWTILVDKQGIVRFNNFHVQTKEMIPIIDDLLIKDSNQYV